MAWSGQTKGYLINWGIALECIHFFSVLFALNNFSLFFFAFFNFIKIRC